MPVTWCYEFAGEYRKYCSTGFPVGCHVTEDGQARDACVTMFRELFNLTDSNVSFIYFDT